MAHELNYFGDGARFNHIGIVVAAIKEISPSSEVTIEPSQKVCAAFISLHGITIELLEPRGDDSPIAESLKKKIKLLHICYAVSDIEKAVSECRKYGFHCIAPPVPTIAFHGKKIAWVYSSSLGLFELLEDFIPHG